MNNSINLLIHHHSFAFIENDKIWMQSFIGIWIEDLSNYFNQIGLLMQVSKTRRPEQDYQVKSQNIIIYNTNLEKTQSYLQKKLYIKKLCREISANYQVLLIRGITPRQGVVHNNCRVKKKYFFLVGSLNDSRPKMKFDRLSLIIWILYWIRRVEIKRISKDAQMLSNSPATVDEISKVLKVKAWFVPTNSIRDADVKPLTLRSVSKAPKLLFCGRIVRDKGIIELIESLKLLNEAGYNPRLDIVGVAQAGFMIKLNNLISRIQVKDQVIFHGFVPFGKELLSFYQESDIYVLPSWHEGFPHSIWEAAVTCTPVITTAVGGIPGLLTHEHVIFCEKQNPESIANSIIYCINNKSALQAKVINLHKLVSVYTADKCAKIMADFLYRSVDIDEG